MRSPFYRHMNCTVHLRPEIGFCKLPNFTHESQEGIPPLIFALSYCFPTKKGKFITVEGCSDVLEVEAREAAVLYHSWKSTTTESVGSNTNSAKFKKSALQCKNIFTHKWVSYDSTMVPSVLKSSLPPVIHLFLSFCYAVLVLFSFHNTAWHLCL